MPGLLDYTVLPGIFGGGFPIPARNVGAINPGPLALPFNANPPTAAMVAAAHPQSGFQRVMGALGDLFSGPSDPTLSDEQNSAARRMALMQAGLGMMAASGPSTQPRSLGQILAQGAAIGQQAGGAQREQTAAQSAHEAMQQAVARITAQGIGPDQLKALLAQALMNKDAKAATAIATVLQAQLAADSKGKMGPMVVGGRLVDPNTRKVLYEPPAKSDAGKPIRVYGREFPNTPEGAQQAQTWAGTMSAAMRSPKAAGTGPKTPATVQNAKAEADAAALVADLQKRHPEAKQNAAAMVTQWYANRRGEWDDHDARVYRALAKIVKAQQTGSGNPAAAAAAAAAKGGQ